MVGEVARQLGPLERKAKKARTYQELAAQQAEMSLAIAVDDFLALRSPSTHRTASEMFDLPDPLGPTTAVMPGSSVSALRSAKDLKPLSSRASPSSSASA